jgi:flagellar protein FlgJ
MVPVNSIGISNPGNAAASLAAREQQKTGHFAGVLQQALLSKDNKQLYQACQDLESVFVYRLLSTMRASIPRSDLITRGMATQTFESMLDEEYAKTISRQGSLGLADIMYRQLTK